MAYTTNWQPSEPRIGLPPITDVSTTAKVPVGTVIRAVDKGSNNNGEGEFVYVKGVTNGAVGSWVTINEDGYGTTLLGANAIGRVGILMAVLDASTKYGWAQISGKAVGLALTDYADDGLVYATGTAGSIDDSAVAGDRVKKAIGASAVGSPATGMAEFELDRPFMDDGTAA